MVITSMVVNPSQFQEDLESYEKLEMIIN